MKLEHYVEFRRKLCSIYGINQETERGNKGFVRDAVLFEYGLFMGKLDKRKVIFVSKNKPLLASDLFGVVYIDGSKEAEMRQALKQWLQSI